MNIATKLINFQQQKHLDNTNTNQTIYIPKTEY